MYYQAQQQLKIEDGLEAIRAAWEDGVETVGSNLVHTGVSDLDVAKGKSKADQEEYYYINSTEKVMGRIEEDGGLIGPSRALTTTASSATLSTSGKDTSPRLPRLSKLCWLCRQMAVLGVDLPWSGRYRQISPERGCHLPEEPRELQSGDGQDHQRPKLSENFDIQRLLEATL